MCYPKPGPRCSAHARANFKEAFELHKSLQDSGEPIDTPTFKRATAKLARARVDYQETPEGIENLRKNGNHQQADANLQVRQNSIQRLKRINTSATENDSHQGVEGFKEYITAPPSGSPKPKPTGNNPFSPAAMAKSQRPTPVAPRRRVNAVGHLAKLHPSMVANAAASYGRSQGNANASMTDNQAKKHRTHMSSEELKALGQSLNTIGSTNADVRFSSHLQSREDFQATQSEVQELLSRPDVADRIIEYNVNKKITRDGRTVMERRVLVRDDKAVNRDYIVGGKHNKEWRNGPTNACYSISLDRNEVVTAYYNDSNDNHRSIDESRYTPSLPIL